MSIQALNNALIQYVKDTQELCPGPQLRNAAIRILTKHSFLEQPTIRQLEHKVFENSFYSRENYTNHVRKLCFNCTINPRITTRHTPDQLVQMDDDAFKQGTAVHQLEQTMLNQRQNAAGVLQQISTVNILSEVGAEIKSENRLGCNQCKSNDIIFSQKQVRSSDEPMTVFCTCNACGKRWKI